MRRFCEGDGITGTCTLCDVSVTEPLPAGKPHDRRIVDIAVKKVCDWMEAHYAEFHPEDRRPFEMTADLRADG